MTWQEDQPSVTIDQLKAEECRRQFTRLLDYPDVIRQMVIMDPNFHSDYRTFLALEMAEIVWKQRPLEYELKRIDEKIKKAKPAGPYFKVRQSSKQSKVLKARRRELARQVEQYDAQGEKRAAAMMVLMSVAGGAQ